ncbi:MAG: sigma-70 family RNA polymerase sigma factor [Nibricoccus sp.]
MSDRNSELLQAYTEQRSEAAFTELVRSNLDMVYAAALRQVRDPHLAADIAQGVFIDLAKKAHRLRTHPALVGWLFKSVRYAAAKTVRGEARRRTKEHVMSLEEANACDDVSADWNQLAGVVDDALDDLDERSRTAILLRFFKNLSFAEIAAALQTTEGNARQRTGRALEKLEAVFRRRGITSTSSALAVILAAQPVVAAPAQVMSNVTAVSVSSLGVVGGVLGGVGFAKFAFMTGALAVVITATYVGLHSIDTQAVGADAGAVTEIQTPVQPSSPAANDLPVVAENRTSEPLALTEVPSPRLASRKKTDTPEAKEARQQARQEARRATQTREAVTRRLTPLFEQLDLPAETRERLIQLGVEGHEMGRDVAIGNALTGRDTSQEDYIDWTRAARAESYGQVRALLGEEGFAAFLENELRYQQDAVIEHVQKRLGGKGGELTPDQANSLVNILREEQTFVLTDETIQSASAFLSPEQIEELRVEQTRQSLGVNKPGIQKAIKRNLPKDQTP